MTKVLQILALLKPFISLLLIAKLANGVIAGDGDDIGCLKTIKASISDQNPNGILSSWDFSAGSQYVCGLAGIDCWNVNFDIYLGSEGLQGPFPSGLEFCSSLTGLDLSNNSLTGSLPTDICSMVPSMTNLNLSFNSFSGAIPISLSQCQYLQSLDLSHNEFSGNIPQQLILLTRLIEFNVAQNQLTGPIPTLRYQFGADNFANNLDLCGPPLNIECRSTSNTRTPDVVVVATTLGAVIGFSIGLVLGSFLDCSYLVTRWRIQMINKHRHRAT